MFLLNLLNEYVEETSLINSIIQEHEFKILFIYNHMTKKIFEILFKRKKSTFWHYICDVVTNIIT